MFRWVFPIFKPTQLKRPTDLCDVAHAPGVPGVLPRDIEACQDDGGNVPMIAMTTNSSMSVKPDWARCYRHEIIQLGLIG